MDNMKKQFNCGLVGLGRVSNYHIKSISFNKIELLSLCDLDQKKLDYYATNESYSNVFFTLSVEILLQKFKYDFISVSVSSGNHFILARKVLENRTNLVIEKPVALSLRQIDALIEVKEKYNLKVAVCHQNRFNKAVLKLSSSINKGNFGRIHYGVATIRWNRNQDYYNQASWRGTWDNDGGALMNQSIHNIDLLLWTMNSPVVEVFGYISNKNHPSIEVEDMGIALIKFANGSFGIIESSMNTYPENLEETLSIFGEKGTVVLGGKSVNRIIHWNVKDDYIDDIEVFNEEVDSIYGNGHIALYKDFIEAIDQDREPAITLQDGRNAVEVILAIYKSSFEKRSVQLPLSSDTSTIMFKGMNFD
jgi:UDP-N-acetyl-2-amino-2-deoxyglucuronate dehydrogenase